MLARCLFAICQLTATALHSHGRHVRRKEGVDGAGHMKENYRVGAGSNVNGRDGTPVTMFIIDLECLAKRTLSTSKACILARPLRELSD